uniref:(northern house mosquito) hypothetical protein n=1 Tax=Culex pipiens TaxID=7175 RepID=A0A8D8BTP0_CULPI
MSSAPNSSSRWTARRRGCSNRRSPGCSTAGPTCLEPAAGSSRGTTSPSTTRTGRWTNRTGILRRRSASSRTSARRLWIARFKATTRACSRTAKPAVARRSP